MQSRIISQAVARLQVQLGELRLAIGAFVDDHDLPGDVRRRFLNLIEICSVLLDDEKASDFDGVKWLGKVVSFLVEVAELIQRYDENRSETTG